MDTNTIQPTTNYNNILSNITSYKNDLFTKLLCPQGRAAPTTFNNTTAQQLVATGSDSPVDVVNRELTQLTLDLDKPLHELCNLSVTIKKHW